MFTQDDSRINYLAKRNFVVRASDLPKQFGFEIAVHQLHYDDDEEVMAKNLINGGSELSKFYFVFNINDYLIKESLYSKEFRPTWTN